MTLPRPTDEQIGYTLQLVYHLAREDPGPYLALARITAAAVELHQRRLQSDYHNALRPAGEEPVSGSRDPDEHQWERALHPLQETTQARNAHQTATDKLTKLASQLEVLCGWAPPSKGRLDRRGRVLVQSIGPDGIRRVG